MIAFYPGAASTCGCTACANTCIHHQQNQVAFHIVDETSVASEMRHSFRVPPRFIADNRAGRRARAAKQRKRR